jgi:hypothetical protein
MASVWSPMVRSLVVVRAWGRSPSRPGSIPSGRVGSGLWTQALKSRAARKTGPNSLWPRGFALARGLFPRMSGPVVERMGAMQETRGESAGAAIG